MFYWYKSTNRHKGGQFRRSRYSVYLLYWYKSTNADAGFAGFSRLVFLEPHDVARIVMTCTKGRELSDALYKRVCERFGFKQPVSPSLAVPYAQVFKPSSLPFFSPRRCSAIISVPNARGLRPRVLLALLLQKQKVTQLPQVFSIHLCTECKRPASSKNSEEYSVTPAWNRVKSGWMCSKCKKDALFRASTSGLLKTHSRVAQEH